LEGYAGRILYIDLSTAKTRVTPLNKEFAKKYIGGIGLGIRLLIDNSNPGVEPFSPENPLILTTGPLSGTIAPTGGNGHAFVSKSPLTGGVGEAKSHGFFGSELKRAGYDAVIFEKKAEKPVYAWIDDDDIQLMNAKHLCGKSPQETEELIRKDLGDYYIRVASIGLGGEKMSRVACIMNDTTRAAGRTGMGAIMGYKNLKAIALRGTKDVKVAKPEEFIDFVKMIHERMKGPATSKYRTLGTPLNVLVHNSLGALPTKNFTNAIFDGAEKISGEYLNERFIAKIDACSSCAMRCEHIAVVPEGPYKGTTTRVEYEPLWAFGPHCGVDRLDAIIKAMDLCNYYGLDNLSTGNIIGFAMDCYEHGIITKKDTDGIDLSFGNAESTVEMVHKIGKRDGLGDILAEGVKRAAKKFGKNAEKYANHIKGLEMTGYDIRGLKTAAIGYAVSFRGADHNRHGAYGLDLKGTVDRFKVEKGRGKLVIDIEDLYTIIDSLIVCKFSRGVYYKGYEDLAQYYTLTTGIEMTPEELRISGERINNLARLFNIREGFTRKDDHLPPKIMSTPIPDDTVSKGSYITQKELDFMLDDYYISRGWTKEGIPTLEKLKKLGLDDLTSIVEQKIKENIK
jgi:aldehyde:ferredoxin oxidoreductase